MIMKIVDDNGNVISETKDIVRFQQYSDSPQGVINTIEPSEIGEALKSLNDDTMNDEQFSSIDMKTRLHPLEISGIIVIDTLVSMNFLPPSVAKLTRSKKRLAVSINGQGRQEMVELVKGVRDQQGGSSFMDRILGRKKE
jgi:hypothetical protein